MTTTTRTLSSILFAAMFALTGCIEGPAGERGASGPEGPAGQDGEDGDAGLNGEDGNNGEDGQTGNDGNSGLDREDGNDGNDGEDGQDGENGANAGDYDFRTDDPSAYTRIDRMGMPAIATAVITSKDAYNVADPVDDDAGTFVSEIIANVDFFHAALDDDLTGLGLSPCATAACVAAAAPLVVPDVLSIDVSGDAGFPNGRMLADQAIDITLAVVLLDLNTHPVTFLADLPLNPPANDRPFLANFPFVATPH